MQYSTLLIGEKVDTMRKLASGMSRMGIHTQIADSISTLVHDSVPSNVGAVVLGRRLAQDQRDAIVKQWRTLRPNTPIVRVRAPIGELVAETVRAAAFKASGYEPIAGSPSTHKRTISFPTMTTSTIEITLYRHTLTHRIRIYGIYKEEAVLSGQQIISIPRKAYGYGGERFVVITINGNEKHVLAIH